MNLKLIISSLFVILFYNLSGQTLSQETNWWHPATDAKDICVDETNHMVYTVGSFDEIQASNPGAAIIDQATGMAGNTFPRFKGSVHVAIKDESGGWYFGGNFDQINGIPCKSLAYMDSDGVISSWTPHVVANTMNAFKRTVKSLLIVGDTLYVGGDFGAIDGNQRNCVASFNITTGELTSWAPEILLGVSLDVSVNSMTTNGTNIYVGGHFSTIDGSPRTRLGAFNHNSGLLTIWSPPSSGIVRSIKYHNNLIYSVSGSTAGVAKSYDAATGAQSTWGVSFSGHGNTIEIIGNTAYIGGDFSIGWSSTIQKGLIAVNATTSEILLNEYQTDGEIFSLTATDETLYVGGNFTEFNGQPRRNIASFVIATNTVTDWNPGATGTVLFLTTDNDWLVAGGSFLAVGIYARNGFLEVDGETGVATDWDIDIDSNYMNGIMRAKVFDDKLILAGEFTSDFGNNLVVYDLNTKLPIDFFDAYPNSSVFCMEIYEDKLYIGGKFLSIGSTIRNYAACFDLNTGSLTDWAPLPNDEVTAIKATDDKVFLGGKFSVLNGSVRKLLAAVSLEDGSLLSWYPGHIVSSSPYIMAIEVSGNDVFIGGRFASIGGIQRANIASIDIESGAVNAWNPIFTYNSGPYIKQLAVFGDYIYVGGTFSQVNGVNRRGFANIEKETGDLGDADAGLTSIFLNGGFRISVHAMAISRNRVFLGGYFRSATIWPLNWAVFSPLCSTPVLSEISASENVICPGQETVLSISEGSLNGAVDWVWYNGACEADEGTTGAEIVVSPMESTTYFVKATGGCAEELDIDCLSITIEVEDDVTPPEITPPQNITLSMDGNSCESGDLAAIGTAEGFDTCSDVEITNDAPPLFPVGLTVVTWFATDQSGNVSSATQNVTVEDNEAPQVTCPGNLIVESEEDNCSSIVTWDIPEATDNCTSELDISFSHSPGDIFTFGNTEITYTVVDGAGNEATCSFEITVISNFEIDPEVVNLSCADQNDGAIDLGISGVGNTYDIEWAGPAGFTSAEENLPDLEAGLYSVMVTSENGCSQSAEVTVTTPEEINVEGTSIPNNTGDNGAITITVVGGTEPYTFAWIGPDNYVASSQNLENLSEAGTYFLTVTDFNGCTTIFEIDLESTVGINNIDWITSVYPNPISSIVNFVLPAEFIDKSMTVYDVTGKILDQFQIDDTSFSINLENYANGLYFVKVEGTIEAFKIVKQ